MMPDLARREESGIIYLTDDGLFESTGVRVAFTGRRGGYSKPPYDSLDLADHVGDDPTCISENRRKVLRVLNAPDGIRIANPNQVHGIGIWHATPNSEALIGNGCELSQDVGDKVESDAVIVDGEGVAAMLCYADCAPVILASEDGRFAVVHAGWRGAIGGIVEATLSDLAGDGASPSRVFAYIGPCIRRECFQVSEDVAEHFERAYGADSVSEGHVDLPHAIRQALVAHGVAPEDIVDCGICTVCDDGFFSYRGDGCDTGRHAAIAFRSPKA